jgi:hypothetical protein
MHGLFYCASHVEHGILHPFQKLTMYPSSVLVRRVWFIVVSNGLTVI